MLDDWQPLIHLGSAQCLAIQGHSIASAFRERLAKKLSPSLTSGYGRTAAAIHYRTRGTSGVRIDLARRTINFALSNSVWRKDL